ncbi:MAG: thioredoxin [Lachnospiraceae bacterium]|nr:thioredoxin [Lachnospiraceae bacterium]
MAVINLTAANFDEEVLAYEGTVLVDFWAAWCGPCKMLSPIVDEVAEEMTSDTVKIAKVNVDDEEELARRYGIMSIPTLVVFKGGKEVDRSRGVISKAEIKELLI